MTRAIVLCLAIVSFPVLYLIQGALVGGERSSDDHNKETEP